MHRLIEGYRKFREGFYSENRALFGQLAQGQAPKALVISCSDSRVDPGIIFNTSLGEIFSLRNVANLVPPYSPDDQYHGTSAAIEFAIRALKVEHVIVMGHAYCGGVRALLGAHEGDFIGPWMKIAEPARERAIASVGHADEHALQHCCELETVKVSLDNLRSFPWLAEREATGALTLHGWYFDIERGRVQVIDQRTGKLSDLPEG